MCMQLQRISFALEFSVLRSYSQPRKCIATANCITNMHTECSTRNEIRTQRISAVRTYSYSYTLLPCIGKPLGLPISYISLVLVKSNNFCGYEMMDFK